MSNIVKVDTNTLSHIKSDMLREYTMMLARELQNMHTYMLRASVVLVAIEDSKCYEEDGFESIHHYTNEVLGIKKAQSYAILKVGREFVDSSNMESVLPHPAGNDYTMTQLQALLPLKSVDTAKELANNNIINPDMTVSQIKNAIADYKPNSKKSNNDVDNTSSDTDTTEVNEGGDIKNEPSVRTFKIEHTIKIGHYEDTGEPIAIVDGDTVSYEEAYKFIATGMRGNN